MNAHTMTANDKRAALRKAITAHPDWPAYRDANGLTASSLSSLKMCEDLCQRFGINIEATLADATGDDLWNAEPVTQVQATEPTNNLPGDFCKHGRRLDGGCPDCGTKSEIPPVTETPDDLATALVSLKRALGGSVDADAVRAIVEEAVAPIRAQVNDAAPVLLTVRPNGDEIAKVNGLRHMTFETLLKACTARDTSDRVPNVWLAGPSQSGKTTAAHMVADALGLPFDFHGAMEMAHELLGYRDANGNYHETAFVRLYRDGGVCLLDECDGWASEATLALNAALANGQCPTPDGTIQRHKDFICLAAGNTWGSGATADYIGRNKLDGAFMQRFPVKLAWDYDWKLVDKFSGNPDFSARVRRANKAAEKAGLKVLITPAHAKAGAALIAAGFTEDDAASMTYLADLTKEQRDMVEAA